MRSNQLKMPFPRAHKIVLNRTLVQIAEVATRRKRLARARVEWSLILMALFITMIAVAVPVGKLIDQVGRRIPLLVSYALIATSGLLFVYGDMRRLLIAMPLLGLGQLMMFSSYSALAADLVPKEQRGKVNGFTQFLGYIARAIGILAGGISFTVSHQLPFFLLAVLLIPQFLLTFLLVHESEKREE